MFKTEDAAYAYQDGQWVKSDMQPASDAFEITREGDAFTVLQDGEPIYTDREMQTLCIMDDAAAYGTKDNKVYQIDISTGKHTAICYVEGWESSDWAQQLLWTNALCHPNADSRHPDHQSGSSGAARHGIAENCPRQRYGYWQCGISVSGRTFYGKAYKHHH